MNFYDKVHELVKCLKSTNEYTEYLKLKEEIGKDGKTCEILKDFKKKQHEQQIAYMSTGKIDEEAKKVLENIYSILIQNDKVRQMLEYEMRIDVMLADMQKIIGEGIKDIIEY